MMATTLPMAMNKTVIENIDAGRRRLETSRHGCDTLTATFPGTTLAAVLSLFCYVAIVTKSLQEKAGRSVLHKAPSAVV